MTRLGRKGLPMITFKRIFFIVLIFLFAAISMGGYRHNPHTGKLDYTPIVMLSDCSGITSEMCMDIDDGKVYAWDGDSVELVGPSSGQPLDAELTAIAGLTSAADKGIQFTGSETAGTFDLTSFAKTILDDADEATFKATVNLEIGTDVQDYDADLDDLAGGITGLVKGAGDGSGYEAAVADSDYAAASHSSRHNDGGADEIDRFTEGITCVETETADGTVDVTNGTTQVVRLLESNANGIITDFVDEDEGDHSEFTTGDWFIFRMTDASTTIDFSDNPHIEGNANTDFTGSATQIVDLLFRFQGTYWVCVNLNSGMSDPTTLAVSSIVTTETEYIPVGYMIDGASAPDALATLTSGTDKADARTFAGVADEDLLFIWQAPLDLDASSGVKFRVICIVSAATGPSAQTWQFEMHGFSLGDGDALDGTLGTAQTSNSGSRTDAQYDRVATAWSSAMTSTHITDLTAGETIHFKLYRDVDDTDDYEQNVAVVGVELKYKREHDATF